MKFSFSGEQDEFRAGLRRLLAERSPTKEVRRLMETDAGFEPDAWRKLNGELEQRVQRRTRCTRELEHARDEAESANRAKSEFLSRMSHELRTPMHAILGFGQLLEADAALALAPASRSYLTEMLRAGDRLLGLINELLDLARIDAGQLALRPEPVELAPLLAECLKAIAPVAQLQRVQLPEVPALPGQVRADRERLKQVLLNLLSNAIKHNRRGGQVSVRSERDGDGWRISVTDTGPGLDAVQKERLFHAFERLSTGHAGVDGAGIGLALSKRLVEAMHGQIGLDSEVGVGSCFWVRLQADEAAPAIGCDGTVLYIEDNAVNVLLMEAMLAQQTRLRMLSAETPEAGLQMACAQRPDLILLDIQLPGIDGYEVLRRLRADEATHDIPVIAISANALRADIERGRAAGFDDYLTKPIDQRALVETLKRVVQRA